MVQFPDDPRFALFKAKEMERDRKKWGGMDQLPRESAGGGHHRRWVDTKTGATVIAGTPDTDLI